MLSKVESVLLFSLMCLCLGSCYKSTENFIQQEIPSPDNKYKAIMFSRESGATTGFNTQVSIIEKNTQLPNKPGNIFIADRINDINVLWENNKELHILLPNNETRIYKNEKLFEDIEIIYQYR
ncbi:MAG: hypothetical protein J6Y69_09970 [Treponema sp.]|nr:hypothetical protein [Treponema sp.]